MGTTLSGFLPRSNIRCAQISPWLRASAVACIGLLATSMPTAIAQDKDKKTTDTAKAVPSDRKPADKSATDKSATDKSATDKSATDKSADAPKDERKLAEDRKAREAARKRGEITFDDLKFDIEKGGEFQQEMITPEIEELNKKTLKLRGFILPTSVFQQSGIKQFVLVRDNQECCFGPGAALYDCVIVEMAPGKTANFSTRVVTVKGKLEIDSESFRYPEGNHFAIYKMTAEEVK